MSDLITPADLARFVHPVPEGAVIPALTPYVFRTTTAALSFRAHGQPDAVVQGDPDGGDVHRWTAEPIPEPPLAELALAEQARNLRGRAWSTADLDQLAVIVAELAERIEADR